MVLGDLTGPPESNASLIAHLAVAHLAPKLTPPSGDMRGGQEGAVGGSVEGGLRCFTQWGAVVEGS